MATHLNDVVVVEGRSGAPRLSSSSSRRRKGLQAELYAVLYSHCTLIGTLSSRCSFALPLTPLLPLPLRLNSLALLNPAHPSHSSYRSSSTVTQQQPLAAEENAEDDLCSLSTLLLVSVPGLHISDFNFLPAIAVAPTGVRAALEHHKQERRVASHPYVATTRSAGFNSAEQLVKRFVHECGAVVEGENVKSLWNGVEGRTVRVVQEVGLDEWELVGREARKGRQGVVEQLGKFPW